MSIDELPGAGLPDNEPELAPLVCSACGFQLEPDGDVWPETCPSCGRRVDLKTQFAYSRGRDAFIAGQDILMRISPKVRKRTLTTAEEMEGVQYYIQAYTALQLAFQGELAENQRRLALEMMAAIALIFQQHNTISPLEASYWQCLMSELAIQIDRADVIDKIAHIKPGPVGMVKRWRWQMRLNQLDGALQKNDQKIVQLERNIRFIDLPKVRRKALPPEK